MCLVASVLTRLGKWKKGYCRHDVVDLCDPSFPHWVLGRQTEKAHRSARKKDEICEKKKRKLTILVKSVSASSVPASGSSSRNTRQFLKTFLTVAMMVLAAFSLRSPAQFCYAVSL